MNRESCNGAITATTHKRGNHPPADRRSSLRVVVRGHGDGAVALEENQ
jgi:hypothetical protein